jgi:hypothetical protein
MGVCECGWRLLTNCGGFNHVADGEAFDGLVFGGAARAVGAADGFDVAATFLVASAEKKVLV